MLKDEQDDRQGEPCPGPNGVVTARRPPNSDSVSAEAAGADRRLRLNPNNDHKTESYDDLQLDYKASIFSSLERHLPSCMLGVSREEKVQFMSEILARYLPDSERLRVQKHSEYRQKIMANYQPLHKALYDMQPAAFFVPSFINAINENNKQTLRSIIREPSPGIYTFSMLRPSFCEMLLAEVENFEKWVQETRCKIMRPNTMNKYGAVLDDFGMESMLNQLMHEFVSPMSKVFFPEVGGSSLDSHHGFIVEYGEGKDVSLGFHVDDSEVTLNICLGKQFSGGDLFFRGVRCDKHVNSDTLPEADAIHQDFIFMNKNCGKMSCYREILKGHLDGKNLAVIAETLRSARNCSMEFFEYSHVPGQAILHRGRHRHGARTTMSGNRINLLLWCRSSVFRELIRYQKDFSSWCGECLREKKERHQKMVAATELEFLRRGESMI